MKHCLYYVKKITLDKFPTLCYYSITKTKRRDNQYDRITIQKQD